MMNRRAKWFALGFLHGAGLMAAAAMYASATRPPELPYRSARATVEPAAGPASDIGPRVALPPCTDWAQKDCMAVVDATARPIPEPGTVALVGIALAGLLAQRAQP